MFRLQKFAGTSSDDPLHNHLGVVDKCLVDFDWTEIGCNVQKDDLFRAIIGFESGDFENYLREKDEPFFAELVYKIRQQELDDAGKRLVILLIIANLDDIKEKYLEHTKRVNRKMSSSWKPSIDS